MKAQAEMFKSQPKANITPMMRQYMNIKAEHQDYLLFYRMGDFYELFFDDALVAAETLDIALTKRGKHQDQDIPMCGVPSHSHEPYLEKLIRSGFKVAVCEQLETPEEARKRGGHKAVVKREVTRIITSGTIVEDSLLEAKQANFLCAIALQDGQLSVAWVEVSTGDFYVSPTNTISLQADLARLSPKEIIISEKLLQDTKIQNATGDYARFLSARANSIFDLNRSEKRLQNFYKIASLDGIGNFSKSEIIASGALLEYLEHTHKENLPRLAKPKKLSSSHFMSIDPATRRNLELERSLAGDKKASLLGVIDKTVTATGGRLLGLYLSSPLCNANAINERLNNVEFFVSESSLRGKIRDTLKHFPDIERALSRIFIKKSGPRDLATIRDGSSLALTIAEALTFSDAKLPKRLRMLVSQLGNFGDLLEKLKEALVIDAPLYVKDGGFIRKNFNAQLDALYDLQTNAKDKVVALREKYRKITGVPTLKVSQNNVIGYYVEVTPSNADKVKDEIFVHRQTLGSAIRYTTEELKQLETDLLTCGDKIAALEQEIFNELCERVIADAEQISLTAQSIAGIDLAAALAQLAVDMKYVRPNVDDTHAFEVSGGRHPVVEKTLRDKFIPNSCDLGEKQNLWLITGPNMAGKSTFLRQNALICILAQMGSYVPAKSAHIGVIDKLFSRIGAADDISRGQSTFMVEMVETAAILNNATNRSLVILDEIGRGTATYDGLSLAWAVIENLHNSLKCRTLFATHYHELTDLEEALDSVACYTVNVKEWEGKVVFMHEVIKGKADRSYGIHVAELAGLPQTVTKRASLILETLQNKDNIDIKLSVPVASNENETENEIVSELKGIDIDNLTPREAFDALYKLKTMIK